MLLLRRCPDAAANGDAANLTLRPLCAFSTIQGKDLSDSPTLMALAAREELVRNGKLTTIIFIRDKNAKGQEVSGYIDYALRLKTENFEPYFEKRKKLMPKPSDLSYFNWETQTSTSNR